MKNKLGILSACFVMMSYLLLSPVLSEIAASFPETDISVIQMLITLPTLITLLSSLIAGRLVVKFYKKTLVLWGMSTYLTGGLLPLIYHGNIWFLLVCSGIIGLGTGTLVTLTASLICDYFTGKERDQMMGLQAALISGGGMVFTLIGGWISQFGWEKTYLTYLLVIPFFVLVILFLPKGILEVSPADKKDGRLPVFVWYLSLIGFLFYVCQNTFNTNVSLLMAQEQIGSTQTAGFATSFYTFGGLLSGILLGQLMSILRNYSVPASILSSCIGLFLTFIGQSAPVILIGGFLVGFGFSMFTPAGTLLVAEHVPESQRSFSIAVFSSCSNIGSALSPVIINACALTVGTTFRSKFAFAAAALLVITALTILQIFAGKRRQAKRGTQIEQKKL